MELKHLFVANQWWESIARTKIDIKVHAPSIYRSIKSGKIDKGIGIK